MQADVPVFVEGESMLHPREGDGKHVVVRSVLSS